MTQALRIADHLNSAKESPWFGKIVMANEDSKTATINQRSFVKAVKRYVLTANNPISVRSPEHQNKMFLNYWTAIANLLDVEKPTVLFKYNGVELFCRFSIPVFNKLQNIGDFRVGTIEQLLRDTFDKVEGEFAGVGHPDWWLSGSGPASGLNSGALNKVNHELTRALHSVETTLVMQL